MTTFLLDLWHDLREKRLWPVALGLIVALIAVPVVLSKPAPNDTYAPGPAPQAGSASGTGPAVQVAAEKDSNLGVFDPKNPFKPGVRPRSSATTSTAGPGGSSVASGGGSPTGSVGGSGSSPSVTPGGGSTPVPSVQPRLLRQRLFTYVVDLDFGKRGEEREYKGVKQLRMLPHSKRPVVVFLGVTGDRSRAVFLFDSNLPQRGEGTCKPKPEFCTFIVLSPERKKNGHYVTDKNGQQYTVRLKDIRRVEVKKDGAPAAKSSTKRSALGVSLAGDSTR